MVRRGPRGWRARRVPAVPVRCGCGHLDPPRVSSSQWQRPGAAAAERPGPSRRGNAGGRRRASPGAYCCAPTLTHVPGVPAMVQMNSWPRCPRRARPRRGCRWPPSGAPRAAAGPGPEGGLPALKVGAEPAAAPGGEHAGPVGVAAGGLQAELPGGRRTLVPVTPLRRRDEADAGALGLDAVSPVAFRPARRSCWADSLDGDLRAGGLHAGGPAGLDAHADAAQARPAPRCRWCPRRA